MAGRTTAPRRKLIVVSNRGPVTFDRDGSGRRIERRGAGGLVTALRPLVAQHDVTWIASALTDEDRHVAAEGPVACNGGGGGYRLRLVAHDPEAYDLYYNVLANPALWFLQHGIWGLRREGELGTAWRDGYVRVNEAFAAAVAGELEREPDAAVFFQDYHLYVAPRLVRERAPGALLSHFVHIPWAEPHEWRLLPEPIATEIHEGVLANDVLGFHTERWRSRFLRSCAELGLEPGRTLVSAHPISVDPQEFESLATSEAVLERERKLLEDRPDQLVLRVDRTDPAKNVVRGLRAFGLLLDRRPDLRGSVRMLALLDPSRQEIPEYVAYRGAIEQEAAAVEQRHPGALRLRLSDDFPGSVAAYKQFDVLLVNSIADGLNLVSKEAPLVNLRDGVVVLSENAGAYEELREWVVPVQPLDVEGQVAALERALALPQDERRRQAAAIREHVRTNDLAAWAAAELGELDRASTMRT